MVVDLMLEHSRHNLNISENSQIFLEGLYENLDPYEPFLEQQSQKQLKWLQELHENHILGDASW